MRQVREAATKREVPIVTYMALMMFVVSVSVSLLLPRTASALSLPLLDTTTRIVTQTLRDTTAALQPTPTPQPNPAPDTTQSSSGAPLAARPSAESVTPYSSQPSTTGSHPSSSLATVTPLDTSWLVKSDTATATPRYTRSLTVDQPTRTSSADSLPFLQPTERGWSLFGVLWCWWLLGLAAVGVAVYALIHHSHRQNTLVS